MRWRGVIGSTIRLPRRRRAPAVRSPAWCASTVGGSPCRASSSGRKPRAAGLSGGVFSWGDARSESGELSRLRRSATPRLVGCFPANGFGLFDMVGNVWEWTRSRFELPYPVSDETTRERDDLKAGYECRWSCAAARASASRPRPLCLSPRESSRRPRLDCFGFPGGVAFFPCWLSSGLWCSALCNSGSLRLWRGCGGDFPRPRAARGFFAIHSLAGWRHPVRQSGRSCAAVRGTIIETTRAVPTATGINPTTGTTISVSGWCCVLPRSSAPSSGPACRRDGAPVAPGRWRSGNAGRSARAGLPAEAKEEEQRQTWSGPRARPQGQIDTRGIDCAGRIRKHRARPGPTRPPCPRSPDCAQAVVPGLPAKVRNPESRRFSASVSDSGFRADPE